MSRLSFAMFSPFFPIAFPMSPSLTTKMSLSPASTQSTTVVRVRSWKSATYLIVCSSKTISTMRTLDAQDVRLPGADDRERGDGERHPARGAQVDVRPGEPEGPDLADRVRAGLRAVRCEDHKLRGLRFRGTPDFPQAEPHVARIRRDAKGSGHVDHGTTSSIGSSGSMGAGGGVGGTAGFAFGTEAAFGRPAGGL